jgi:HK97 gp10 family phage protein
MITVTTNAEDVAGALQKLSSTLDNGVVTQGVQPFLRGVQATAKKQHRYHRQSGKLERAIKVELTNTGGSVYIDDGIAPYGKYVHNGTRKWDSDPFLTEAFDEKSRDLDRAVDLAIDKAINEAGL